MCIFPESIDYIILLVIIIIAVLCLELKNGAFYLKNIYICYNKINYCIYSVKEKSILYYVI